MRASDPWERDDDDERDPWERDAEDWYELEEDDEDEPNDIGRWRRSSASSGLCSMEWEDCREQA